MTEPKFMTPAHRRAYTVQHNNGFPCAAYRHFDPSQQGQL